MIGFVVAIVVLMLIAVIWTLIGGQNLSVNPPSWLGSTTYVVGIGLGFLFLLFGFVELIHEAGIKQTVKKSYLVPSLFIFIGLVLIGLTFYNGSIGLPGVDALSELAGLMAVLIVGTIAFFAMDHLHATHALLAPVAGGSAGSGTTIIIQNKTSSGGKVMTIIMLIIMIVVLYVLYMIVQDVMGIVNAAKCGFILCGL